MVSKIENTAFLSGFAIAVAAYCYSTLNGTVAGAVLFSFGLVTVILYKWKLYTGSAGFVRNLDETLKLAPILFFNLLGCFCAALIFYTFAGEKQDIFISNAIEIRKCKSYFDIIPILLKGICCGFIMTVAVKNARNGIVDGFQHFIPLLLGVPIFLLSGFFHSIVDVFYISYGWLRGLDAMETTLGLCQAITGWVFVVIGNFIGCNLIRIIMIEKTA